MAISVDARTAGVQRAHTSQPSTWTHVIGTGSDRILAVAVSVGGSSTATVSSVTYGAAALTEHATVNLTTVGNGWGGPLRIYLFYLIAPATGSDTITVTPSFGAQGRVQASSVSLFGVHQSSPFNAAGPHTQNTTNAQPSIVVTSAADEWCLAAWSAVSNPDPAMSLGAGQSSIGDHYEAGTAFMQHLFTDEDAGGTSVTMNYTGLNIDPGWGIGGIGVSLVPAAANVTVTPAVGLLTLAGFLPSLLLNQLAVPISVLSLGGWTDEAGGTTNLYTHIDEAEAINDTDYVRSVTEPVDDELIVGLTALSTPVAGAVTVRVRHGTI